MTMEEAIAVIKARCHYCEHFPKCVNDRPECFKSALMAIRSLEAWDKVIDGLAEYEEEYSGTDENGNHNLKWCAIKEAEALVQECLKEVKE